MNSATHNNKLSVRSQYGYVGKISLGIAVVAGTGLVLALALLVDDKGFTYGEIIGAHDLARRNLWPALLSLGLASIAFAGIATWLMTLQLSIRVAGPLYRLSRNMEIACERGPVFRPRPIRVTDHLQDSWKHFASARQELASHYGEIYRLLTEMENLLANDAAGRDEIHNDVARVVAQLKEAACRGRV